ncbi:MAG TPA: hypothetical protein VIJ47_07820 [Acidimicrobiales bacterium]
MSTHLPDRDEPPRPAEPAEAVEAVRHLPIRREAVAPPRRGAPVRRRRRAFTAVVLVWVVLVIAVPALALRSPSSPADGRTATMRPATPGGLEVATGPLTESPPRPPAPTTTLPDPVAYARLGLPVPDLSVAPPQIMSLRRTPGVDAPFETPPPTAVPPVTAPPVQVLNQTVGVEVRRTDTPTTTAATTPTTGAGAEVAGATATPSHTSSGTLARTGLEPWVLALVGVGLVALGGLAVWLSRRRAGAPR